MAEPLTAFITCDPDEGGCGAEYEGFWPAPEEDEEQDQPEAPVAVQTCPSCGHQQARECPLFYFRDEAG